MYTWKLYLTNRKTFLTILSNIWSGVMKIICALAVVALMLMLIQSNVSAAPNINVTLTKQTPYPASPGEAVSLEVEIQNSGYDDALENIVEMNLKSPFILQPGQENTRTFNRIPARGSIKTSYDIFTGGNASTGQYEIEFLIYTRGDGVSTALRPKVMLNVRGTPRIILESVTTVPEDIAPGDTVTLNAVFRNVGTGTAKKAEVSLTSTAALIPILSGGSYYIGDMAAGKTGTAAMQLSVTSTADYGIYQIPLDVSYSDESNAASTASFSPGIPVRGMVDLQVISMEPAYTRGILKIEVANKGTADAESLEAKLMVDGRQAGTEYISSLKATKKTTLNFPMVMNGAGKLVITYRGPGTEKSTAERDLMLDFKNETGGSYGELVFIVIIIITAAAVFVAWKKLR
jgi:hypothetical protein